MYIQRRLLHPQPPVIAALIPQRISKKQCFPVCPVSDRGLKPGCCKKLCIPPPVIPVALLHKAIQLQQRVVAATAVVDEHLLAPAPGLGGHNSEG